MLCNRCKVKMKSGTRYEQRENKSLARRYDECPECHTRKYNNNSNFQQMLKTKLEHKD